MSGLHVRDWLLVESLRRHEERFGRRDDAQANALALSQPGALPARLLARARALPEAAAVQSDIGRLLRLLGWITAGLAILGLVLGGLAARMAIADRQVDVLLALAGLLLMPTLMLLVWLGVLLWPQRGSAAPAGAPGRVAVTVLRRLAPRLLDSPLAAEAGLSLAAAAATPWGRWRLSGLTHLFWLCYALGALGMLTLLFSVARYDLSWGTTLLSEEQLIGLVQLLTAWPRWLGLLPAAGTDWILAGSEGGMDAASRALWARFLLAMILAWALLPRLVLSLFSAVLAFWFRHRMPLDTRRPGYLRLVSLLQPAAAQSLGSALPPLPAARPRRRRKPGSSEVVLVRVELDEADKSWDALLPGVSLLDLGQADDRAGRAAVLGMLAERREPAAGVLAVCSMLRTPDAGTEAFLLQLMDSADAPLWLLLDEEGRLAERAVETAARRRDWQALAKRIGAVILFIDHRRPDAGELARLLQSLRDEEVRS